MLYAYEPFDLMVMQTVELMDENDKLKLENAKLRELVREMYTTISWCDENTYPTAAKKAEYSDAMRELGIEVSE